MLKAVAQTSYWPPAKSAWSGFLLLGGLAALSLGIVHSPWLTAGAALGAIVLAVALTQPLALVALMLVIGPVDLSFLTGGFKALFPDLGGLDMNGIRLLGATAGFLGFILVSPRAQQAAFGRLGRIWLLFLVYAGFGLLLSPDPLEGARLWLKIAYPFFTFLVVVGLADSREQVLTLLKYSLVAAAVIAVIVNPIFALDGAYRVGADGFRRIRGLGAHENPFSFYLMAMLLIAFTRLILRSQIRYALLAAVLGFWMVLTYTRITMLATTVGLVVIALLAVVATGNRKLIVGGAVAVAALVLVALPPVLERSLGFVPTPAELLQLLRNPAVMYNAINWQGRQLLWAIAWGAFMMSPLTGLGLGASTVFLRENIGGGLTVVHNEYLRLATDTGLVGVGLMTLAIVGWLVAAVRYTARKDLVVREFAIAAAAIIVAWGIIAITDNAFDYYTPFTQYAGFLLAGAVVASRRDQREEEKAI